MWKTLPATTSLLGVNVALYLLTHNLLPENNRLLSDLPLYFIHSESFRVWQLITHMFMHASVGHLLMNMFGLFSFGSILERVWGMKKFLLFYFLSGVGAALIYTAVNVVEVNKIAGQFAAEGVPAETLNRLNSFPLEQYGRFAYGLEQASPGVIDRISKETVDDYFVTTRIPMVGASGALYGILTAFGLLFPNAKLNLIFLPIPIAAKFFIPVILLMDLFSGVTGFSIFGRGIAHFAHLGGALIGFLLMLLWRKQVPQQPPAFG